MNAHVIPSGTTDSAVQRQVHALAGGGVVNVPEDALRLYEAPQHEEGLREAVQAGRDLREDHVRGADRARSSNADERVHCPASPRVWILDDARNDGGSHPLLELTEQAGRSG